MTETPHPDGLRFDTEVRVRWSDMDVFGHVNNARTLTLLEEGRVAWLFVAARDHGATDLPRGIVVAEVHAKYRLPIGYEKPVTVSMWVSHLAAASFTIGYEIVAEGSVAVTAETLMVPVDPETFRPRRLDPVERAYLARFESHRI